MTQFAILRDIADVSEADFGGWWELSFLSGYALFLTHNRILSQQRSSFLSNRRRRRCLHRPILSILFIWLHWRLGYGGKIAGWRLSLFWWRRWLFFRCWRSFLRWLLQSGTLEFLWHIDGLRDLRRICTLLLQSCLAFIFRWCFFIDFVPPILFQIVRLYWDNFDHFFVYGLVQFSGDACCGFLVDQSIHHWLDLARILVIDFLINNSFLAFVTFESGAEDAAARSAGVWDFGHI